MDLDVLAWLPTSPPQRMPLEESRVKIEVFLRENENWVVEGCYTDLLELLVEESTEIIFMDLSIEQCIENARNRPWEPHKYESKEAQDSNLDMLTRWIKDYKARSDTFSYEAHLRFYKTYQGKKAIYAENKNIK
ncbi:hypothetical protein Misp06_00596 [Microbulbifer sp. NBRC 101763]